MVTRIDTKAVGTAVLAGTAMLLGGAALSSADGAVAGAWSAWVALAWITAGFVVVGAIAGWIGNDRPIQVGSLAALGTLLVVVVFWIAVGDRSLPSAGSFVRTLPVAVLLAATGGTAGSLLADLGRRRARRRRRRPGTVSAVVDSRHRGPVRPAPAGGRAASADRGPVEGC